MKKIIKLVFAILISIFFLYFAMKDVKFNEVWDSLKKVKYYYFILVFLFLYLMYVFRTLRWQILLLPVKKTDYKNLFSIMCISFMMLLIFPFRLGEFARAYLIGEKEKISKTSAFSTIVLERILDGCTTVFLFLVAVFSSPKSSKIIIMAKEKLPSSGIFNLLLSPFLNSDGALTLINLIYFVAFFYIAALIFVVLLKIFGNKMVTLICNILRFLPVKIIDKIKEMLESFIEGLNIFHDYKKLMITIIYSFLVWIANASVNYICLISFGFPSSFNMALIILGFSVIGVMIPAAPGFIGTFHYVIKLAFMFYLPSVSVSNAISYAWVVWAVGTFFPLGLGFYYFNKENLKLKEIKENQ